MSPDFIMRRLRPIFLMLLLCPLMAGLAYAQRAETPDPTLREAYIQRIQAAIGRNVDLPAGIQGNPETVVNVSQLPSGEVLALRLLRSSGSPALDMAVVRAIQKSSPLPKPDDPSVFQRDLIIKYRPFAE
jgi:colicin import membrane protein